MGEVISYILKRCFFFPRVNLCVHLGTSFRKCRILYGELLHLAKWQIMAITFNVVSFDETEQLVNSWG